MIVSRESGTCGLDADTGSSLPALRLPHPHAVPYHFEPILHRQFERVWQELVLHCEYAVSK